MSVALRGTTRVILLLAGGLQISSLHAQVSTGSDGVFRAKPFSCPAADSVLGPIRHFGMMEAPGGDLSFATFRWPAGTFSVQFDQPMAQAEIDAMAPPTPDASIHFMVMVSGTALANYRHSPPPHEFTLTVDRKLKLGPFPDDRRPRPADSVSVATLGFRVPAQDAVRLAAGHRARLESRGMKVDLDTGYLDAINAYYRASLCGLSAAPPAP